MEQHEAEFIQSRCQKSLLGCWVWTGATDRGGYGHVTRKRNGRFRTLATHRLSYECHIGEVPRGMMVLHRCDNPPCCNPEHLFLGTAADNVADALMKGRLKAPPERDNSGESNGRVILTTESATQVLTLKGKLPQRQIARLFGVSRATVARIHRRERWAHLSA